MLMKFSMAQLHPLIYDALRAKRHKVVDGESLGRPCMLLRQYTQISLVSSNADTMYIQPVQPIITEELQKMMKEHGLTEFNYGNMFKNTFSTVIIPIIPAIRAVSIRHLYISVDEPELRVLVEDYGDCTKYVRDVQEANAKSCVS